MLRPQAESPVVFQKSPLPGVRSHVAISTSICPVNARSTIIGSSENLMSSNTLFCWKAARVRPRCRIRPMAWKRPHRESFELVVSLMDEPRAPISSTSYTLVYLLLRTRTHQVLKRSTVPVLSQGYITRLSSANLPENAPRWHVGATLAELVSGVLPFCKIRATVGR